MKKVILYSAIYIVLLGCSTAKIETSPKEKEIVEESLSIDFEESSEMEAELQEISGKFADPVSGKIKLFMYSAISGELDTLKYLLANGVDVNTQDGYKNTALHYAAINGRLEIVQYLLANGANVNPVNYKSMTPLHFLIESIPSVNKDTPSAMPVNGNYTSYFGLRRSPITGQYQMHGGIDIATKTGTEIKATADGRVIKAGWNSAFGNVVIIQHATGTITIYGHCQVVKTKKWNTVKKGEVIALVGSTGNSTGPHCHYEIRECGMAVNPLYFLHDRTIPAYEYNSLLKSLIDSGCNVNAADIYNNTALHYAVVRDSLAVKALIDAGANVNVFNGEGLSPLHIAAMKDLGSARVLLNNGAKVNAKSTQKYTARDGKYFYSGSTPLDMAIGYEWLDMAKLLIKYGAQER